MRVAIAMLAALVMLASCSDPDAERTASARFAVRTTEDARTIGPDALATKVEVYELTGYGPYNSTVSVKQSSQEFALDGLLQGTWEFEAAGYSIDSEHKIVTSQRKTFAIYAGDGTTKTLVLDQLYGTGSCNIGFVWDTSRVRGQWSLEVGYRRQGGTEDVQVPQSDLTGSAGAMRWKAPLDAGSYVVHATLYDEGLDGSTETAGGVTSALRVIDEIESKGDLEIVIDKQDTDVFVEDRSSVTLEGSVSAMPVDDLDSDDKVPVKASFTLDEASVSALQEQGLSEDDLTVEWASDSKVVVPSSTDGLSAVLPLSPRLQTLTAVVSSPKLGSMGSSFKVIRVEGFDASMHLRVPSGQATDFVWPQDVGSQRRSFAGWKTVDGGGVEFPYTADGDVVLRADYRPSGDVFTVQGTSIVSLTDEGAGTEYLSIPGFVTKVGSRSFEKGTGVKAVAMGDAVSAVGTGVFPESVTVYAGKGITSLAGLEDAYGHTAEEMGERWVSAAGAALR